MKILHTADTHIGTFPGPTEAGKNLRMRDTTNCMVALANSAMTEKPDLIIIAGDLFHRSRLWADEMLVEIQIAANWLTDLSLIAPVCLLYGTPNHDNEEAFKNLFMSVPPNVHIFTRPERRVIDTSSGPVQVCGLPGFDRGYFRAQNPGVSREDENAVFSNALSQIVMGLSAQCTQDAPCVLVAHYTVPGANLESGQVQIFSQAEPMLTTDTLAASDFDLVTLGHIHRPQAVNGLTNVFYSGAINRFNFNDEGQPRGFWYHELTDNVLVDSRFVATPARAFCTVRLQTDEIGAFNLFGALPNLPEVKGNIVRVLYSCTDEHEKALNKSALEKYLYEMGAFWVQEIIPSEIIVTLDRKAMDESTSPEENLETYLRERGCDEDRIDKAVELARPIIADVVASARSRLATGILRPISIEVLNYRNYREASFDFSDISMCTINGQNGAGKSSLFMDAVVDCLYEEPREADLTGWIRADEEARSGAITFTFSIGEVNYRVSRTRARSGKATLNLSEFVDGEWKNRSRERLRDTQDEITALLGMDIGTFKSCALIMQDQYGIFLESGKEQRMETLAAMLGLGIYEAMEETAKAKNTEVMRAIRSAQDQEAQFDKDLQRESAALEDKRTAQAEVTDASAKIDALREREAEVRAKVLLAKQNDERLQQLRDDYQKNHDAAQQLEQQRGTLRADMEKLGELIRTEPALAKGAAEYSAAVQACDTISARIATVENDIASRSQANALIAQYETDLQAKEARRAQLAAEKQSVESIVVSLLQFKGSAQLRDEAAEKIQQQEKARDELDRLAEKKRVAQAALTACATKHDQAITAKETEIATAQARAALLLDSKCIDSDNAKCVFLDDAIRSRDALPALEAELTRMRSQKEAEMAPLRDAESAAQMAVSRVQYDPDTANQLQQEHATHVANASRYEQRGVRLDRITAIDTEISAVEKEITDTNHRLSRERANAETRKELETQLATLQQRHGDAVALKQQLQASVDQYNRLPETKERFAQIDAQQKQLEALISERKTASAAAYDELVKLQANSVDVATASAPLGQIAIDLQTQDTRKTIASTRLGSANKVLEIVAQAKQQVAILRAEVKALSESATLYAELKQAFSKDGIPHNIIRSILPVLESTANNILSQMTGGKMSLEFVTERTLKSNAKKEVTTLDIFIHEAGRSRLPYLSKSGGEKVKVSLSVVLALAEIMSRRAGIQLGFLFIDEPPFLDDIGTQAYCDALEAIRTRYPGHIIMAITHDPTMKARFPQSIDIERTDEGSKVVYT